MSESIFSWIGILMAVLIVATLSSSSILMLLIGLREVRSGAFHARVWGLSCVLLAFVTAKVELQLFAHAHRGLTALGIAVGVIAALFAFRRSKPMRYPRSQLWLWVQIAFTLALAAWVFIW